MRINPNSITNGRQIIDGLISNVVGSQMVFTLHNTAVLNNIVFRRDQIYLVNKDKYGRSSLQMMHTSKHPIRKDAPMERDYLDGEVGGISTKLNDKDNLLF